MVAPRTKVFAYYPGCELRNRARGLDLSARRALSALGITLEELKDWTCCGGLVPQVKDSAMGFLAPARIFVESYQQGCQELVTLCAFCFNTLKRASFFFSGHPEVSRKLAVFLGVERLPDLRVRHFLEILRDEVGSEGLRAAVKVPLRGLRVAPYYGCLLLRPARELGLDDPEEPTLMEGLLRDLGCAVVEFPAKTDCCGSYHVVTNSAFAAHCVDLILRSALRSRAELIVASCPVCHFNLDWGQREDSPLPVVYFPQLLALALGEPGEALGFGEQAAAVLSVRA